MHEKHIETFLAAARNTPGQNPHFRSIGTVEAVALLNQMIPPTWPEVERLAVSQWRSRGKIPAKFYPYIEIITAGAVTVDDLRRVEKEPVLPRPARKKTTKKRRKARKKYRKSTNSRRKKTGLDMSHLVV